MNYEKATNDQLMIIAKFDKDCYPSLLREVAIEMMKRNLWDNWIMFSGKQAFRSLNYVLKRLGISHKELIQIGHIEIYKVLDKFKPGMRCLTSYVCMCLITKFKKMDRDAKAEKRIANMEAKSVDRLDPKIADKLFQSPVNVEHYVVNKITIEDSWQVLREVEKQAILMDLQGYSQYEIAQKFGFQKTYGVTLLKRAYLKLRKAMVA